MKNRNEGEKLINEDGEYQTKVKELMQKTGASQNDIEYILKTYGTMENFVSMYVKKELDEKGIKLASSILREVIDVDMSPKRDIYDAIYMQCIRQHEPLEFYSSEKVRQEIDKLSKKSSYVIKRRFGLLSDDIPTLKTIGEEIGVSGTTVANIQKKAIRALSHPSKMREAKARVDSEYLHLITDEEKSKIEEIRTSELAYRNNHTSMEQLEDKEILETLHLIKNVEEINEERKTERENTLIEDTDMSADMCTYLRKANIEKISDLKEWSYTDSYKFMNEMGRENFEKLCNEVEKYCPYYKFYCKTLLTMSKEEIASEVKKEQEIINTQQEIINNQKLFEIKEKMAEKMGIDKRSLYEVIEASGIKYELAVQMYCQYGVDKIFDLAMLTEKQVDSMFKKNSKRDAKQREKIAKIMEEYNIKFLTEEQLKEVCEREKTEEDPIVKQMLSQIMSNAGISREDSMQENVTDSTSSFAKEVVANAQERAKLKQIDKEAKELEKGYKKQLPKQIQ